MKKFTGAIKDAGSSVSHAAQKVTSKPTTKDEEFEDNRNKFLAYKKAIEETKKCAVKLQDETKGWIKAYTSLGSQFEEFFNLRGEDDGRKFKTFTGSLDNTSTSVFLAALGEVIAGTEQLININDGLKKRIGGRDDLLLDMDIAAKDKDKDAKKEQKYNESVQKYEEVNEKLKKDIQEAMHEGNPKFKEHYEKLVHSQKRTFEAWASAAGDV